MPRKPRTNDDVHNLHTDCHSNFSTHHFYSPRAALCGENAADKQRIHGKFRKVDADWGYGDFIYLCS